MVEAAHAREGDHLRARRRPGLAGASVRRIPEARVYPLGVVVGDVVREKPPEVALAENDQVMQDLAPTGSHPPLGPIGPW